MNQRKNVAFDTSVLISILNKESVFDENGIEFKWDETYPKEDYNRCIPDNAAFELTSSKKDGGSRKDQAKERGEFLNQHQFYFLKPNQLILIDEYMNGFNTTRNRIHDENTRQRTIEYLMRDSSFPEIECRYRKIRDDIENSRNLLSNRTIQSNYVVIAYGGESDPFDRIDLEISLSGRMWLNFVSFPFDIRETGDTRMAGKQQLRHPRSFGCLKDEYPTVSMLLDLDEFLNKESQSNNTWSDLRIFLCAPYMDSFVTCDKGQANIIRSLFPQYAHIVKLFKANPHNP